MHSFKLPPASLKNFGLYVKQLSAAGIPLTTVKTLVGFDLTQTYPVLVFQYGGFIGQGQPEDKQRAMIDHFAKMATSVEVEDIVNPIAVPSTKQIAAPAAQAPPPPPEDDMGIGGLLEDGAAAAEAEAEAKKKVAAEAAAKKKKAAADKKAKEDAAAKAAANKTAVASSMEADFDMEMNGPAPDAGAGSGPSDDDLMKELGL